MNRLELQGRDRDKLIYLKKGGGKLLLKSGHLHYLCPYYSTDRNDAWELWNELPLEYKHDCITEWGYSNYVSEDFADAVSKAWLQWYYNTQWMKE